MRRRRSARRISAELHDALAHALGAMVVQASVASDLVRRDAEAAAAALRAVAQAGRDALGETGRLLRLLRDDRDELGLQLATAPSRAARPRRRRRPAPPKLDLLLPALFGVIGTVEIGWDALRARRVLARRRRAVRAPHASARDADRGLRRSSSRAG